MSRVATAWRWLLAKVRDRRTQLRLCLRVTVAALASFVLAQLFPIPLAGLWAVLTAVVVTQMSLGGSLKATIEYSVGTLGGAVYAGTIATLVPHYDEISLLAVLALAVAPLALLAAVDPHFRVGPFTAVIVVLGASGTHTDPIGSAFYRVLEVALGGVTGLMVSFLVLPARAHVLVIDAAADMLGLLARPVLRLYPGSRCSGGPTGPEQHRSRVRACRRSRRRGQTRANDLSWGAAGSGAIVTHAAPLASRSRYDRTGSGRAAP